MQAHFLENRILSGMPDAATLFPSARMVEIAKGESTTKHSQIMASVDFPTTALLSIIDVLQDGSTAEITNVGSEGFVEVDAAYHHDTALRTSEGLYTGAVIRVSIDDFKRALESNSRFADRVYHSIRIRQFIVEQLCVCSMRHDANQRLARWLLLLAHKMKTSTVAATHEEAAGMLGIRRATVSTAAQQLLKSGAITYGRGIVGISDAAILHGFSCDCFGLCRDALDTEL
jgi:hypothetical protein